MSKNTRQHLTKPLCDRCPAPQQGERMLWDDSPTGLGLRVTATGSRSWILMYRKDGRLKKLTIGQYPGVTLDAARKASAVALGQVALDRDPAQDKIDARLEESGADTFKALCESYLNDAATKEMRTYERRRRNIEIDLLPKWRRRKARDISRKDVLSLIANRGTKKNIAANRLLELISRIFNFGMRQGTVDLNPAYHLPKPGVERQRERHLDDDELRRVWTALDTEPMISALAYRMLVLTGQRKSEVLGMKWSELDLVKNLWTIPGARTKNKADHRVPLVGQALEIIESIKSLHHAGEYVFDGPVPLRPLRDLADLQKRIVKSTRLEHFTLHDLRRTMATGLGDLRVADATISKILNHKSGPNGGAARITMVYNRSEFDREKRQALELWDSHVRQVIGQMAEIEVQAS